MVVTWMLSTTMVGGGGSAGAAVGACCAGAMLEQNNSRVRMGGDFFMVGFYMSGLQPFDSASELYLGLRPRLVCVGPSALISEAIQGLLEARQELLEARRQIFEAIQQRRRYVQVLPIHHPCKMAVGSD